MRKHPFIIDAVVILPDHLHCIWIFFHHVEYIHYNPVKHGLVTAPKDWEYSSFHRAVRQGIYDMMWGAGEEIILDDDIGNE
jgi:putative transposase